MVYEFIILLLLSLSLLFCRGVNLKTNTKIVFNTHKNKKISIKTQKLYKSTV